MNKQPIDVINWEIKTQFLIIIRTDYLRYNPENIIINKHDKKLSVKDMEDIRRLPNPRRK